MNTYENCELCGAPDALAFVVSQWLCPTCESVAFAWLHEVVMARASAHDERDPGERTRLAGIALWLAKHEGSPVRAEPGRP